MSRHGGFAPVQWVLARYPRSPATLGDEQEAADIGAIQAHVDGPTEFALQAKYRQAARQQFVNWDCGERVQRALLRNAAPIAGPYKVGDIVSYCRRPRPGEGNTSGVQWSVGCRIVGFEPDPNDPTKTPSTAWVICDGVPVCVATDKIRPCTAAELLAYQYLHGETIPRSPLSQTTGQQSFIDERDPPTKRTREPATESPRPATETSQPLVPRTTQVAPSQDSDAYDLEPSAKELRESPKELRAITATSSPSRGEKRSASPGLLASMKRNNVTGKGLETVSYTHLRAHET